MHSLNARVALSAGMVLAVFIALAAFALDQAFRDSARSAREERLLAQVYLLMSAAEVDAHGAVTIASGPLEPRFDMPQSGLYAIVTNAEGNVVWRSRSALNVDVPYGTRIPAGVHTFDQVTDRAGHGYFLQSFGVSWATSGGSFPFTFSVAEDLQPFEQQLSAYRKNLWGWLGATALLLLIAQWFTLRWGLRPLRRLADEVSRLEHGEQQQIAGDYPEEVKGLTANLNTLLTHERARQKRYRDALADLAHSLKTPLALVRGALNQTSSEPALARTLQEQVDHMDRIVGYHLQRAAASGRGGLLAPQAVRTPVERMVNALSKVYAEKHIDIQIDVDPALRFRGDEADLLEMLGNVLDNACKWCRSRVRVSAQASGSRLSLCVEDDGAGIASSDAQRVLQRGVRADQSVPGQGIGLAVTRDIVEAYDGEIIIGASALGGAAITLLLPGLA
jgi:two-component system, OmpR family, sensor histidine kinase PhoQ